MCLLVEAPAPDVKLAALSEIAQEHGVEWDAAKAAREMLPPAQPQAMPSPPPHGDFHAPPGGGGPMPQYGAPPQQQFVMPTQQYGGALTHAYAPQPPAGMQYADANQAAAAAAHAAAQARAAADYAAQFAMHQAGLVPPSAGSHEVSGQSLAPSVCKNIPGLLA